MAREEAHLSDAGLALGLSLGGASDGGGVMKRERVEEDDDGSARKKLRLTKEQSALLEDRFKEHSTLNPKQKVALAKQLHLRPRQVEVWFQNRRARTKLKQTEVDCEFLKRCCEALTEENRRLQRELRALKFAVAAPPPATVCPSCVGDRLGDPDRPNKQAGRTATCSTPSPAPPPASAPANRARTLCGTSDMILPSSRFFIWGPGNS